MEKNDQSSSDSQDFAFDPGFFGPIIPRFAPNGTSEVIAGKRIVGMGWQPDVPDFRDYTVDIVQEKFREQKKKIPLIAKGRRIKKEFDNRMFCSPIENQGTLGSCTAHAVGSMMEYLMRKKGLRHVDLSRLFLYKVTRKLLGWTGDTGAYIRSTIKAAAIFGIPPEEHFSYDITRFEEEPSAFLYSYASNFQALNYARLDEKGLSSSDVLNLVKRVISSGFCIAFGFPVYSSISRSPDIPFPSQQDRLLGGHAVLAVGYNDNHKANGNAKAAKKEPSLIIRNSWGTDWGEKGYGYLPYKYVEEQLAIDFWAIFKEEWIDIEEFK
jgi:C1A family cysteine protease